MLLLRSLRDIPALGQPYHPIVPVNRQTMVFSYWICPLTIFIYPISIRSISLLTKLRIIHIQVLKDIRPVACSISSLRSGCDSSESVKEPSYINHCIELHRYGSIHPGANSHIYCMLPFVQLEQKAGHLMI